MQDKTWKNSRIIIYIITFLWNLHVAIPTYITSTFLANYTGNATVGVVYTAAALLAITCFVIIVKFLRRFGNTAVILALLFVEFISMIVLAFVPVAFPIIAFFIASFSAIALIDFTIDSLLEDFSTNSKVGDIRGINYTFANLGWLIAPFLAALLLGATGNDFSKVFLVVAVILVPVILLLAIFFMNFKDPDYSQTSFLKGLGEMLKDRDMRGVYIIDILVQAFYALMIIYTPIYLHDYIGFDWTTIGILFSVMLIPFVLVGIPEGIIADAGWGERWMMAAGFLVCGLATLGCAILGNGSAILWAILLFLTRVGAASSDVMSDAYFFRKVNGKDIQKIAIYRTARPVAYVLSSIVATILLAMTDIRGLLVVLGFLMFYGIRVALSISDVK